MRGLEGKYPKGALGTYMLKHIARNWQDYFPGVDRCPPVIYLDLAPFAPAIAVAIDPALCAQITQEHPQPRHPVFKFALSPVTRGRDLISMDVEEHRIWRAKLNPGFSSRNIMSLSSVVIDECSTFVDVLKKSVGTRRSWGDIFAMQQYATNLTLCVITRVVLYVHKLA
jgi:cytochrome P450